MTAQIHEREATTPMKDGEPTTGTGDTLLADCSCGGTYSVPAGGPGEYARLEAEHTRHVEAADLVVDCVFCGDEYNTQNSDAPRPNDYCSAEHQRLAFA